MKLGILVCEETPATLLRSKFATSASRFEKWLGPVLPEAVFRSFLVYRNSLPSAPSSHNAYLVTGSPTSINASENWLGLLMNFLRLTARAQIPVIGIGFGHQAIAAALGGRVAATAKSLLGLQELKLVREEGWLRTTNSNKLSMLCMNSEQVTKLPSRSVRIATGPKCANGIYRVANHSVGIQGHPELSSADFLALLDTRSDLSDRPSMTIPTSSGNRELIAKWCARFVTSNV